MSIFYYGDARQFHDYARAILSGQLFDSGIPFHPPAFAYLLAGIHLLTGAGADAPRTYLAVKIVLAFLGSLPVGLIYILARPYLGRLPAMLTSLLCLYHFGFYVLAVAPANEIHYLTLFLFALIIWTNGMKQPLSFCPAKPSSNWLALFLGLLLGLLALMRAEGIWLAILIVVTGIAGILIEILHNPHAKTSANSTWRSHLRPLWPLILLILGWGIAVTPWTIRNAIRLNEFNRRMAGRIAEPFPTFVPLTIYGPLNMALANNAEAEGFFSRRLLSTGPTLTSLNTTNPQHLRYLLHGDRVAWDWIRQHPQDYLRLVWRKWGLFFAAWKLGWTQWDWPGGLSGIRRPADMFVPDRSWKFYAAPALSLLGICICLGRRGNTRRWGFLVMLLTGGSLASTAIFFGYIRQGMLCMPFWLSLAAVSLIWLGQIIARILWQKSTVLGRPTPEHVLVRRFVLFILPFVLILMAAELWGISANRQIFVYKTQIIGQFRLIIGNEQPNTGNSGIIVQDN